MIKRAGFWGFLNMKDERGLYHIDNLKFQDLMASQPDQTLETLAYKARCSKATVSNSHTHVGCSLRRVIAILKQGFGLKESEWRSYLIDKDQERLKKLPVPVTGEEASSDIGDFGVIGRARSDPAERTEGHQEIAEKTYLRYKSLPASFVQSPTLIAHLEARYSCRAIRLHRRSVAATVIWENSDQLIAPNSVLGVLDQTRIPPAPLERSSTLTPSEYRKARAFIKREYTKGQVKHEGINYCMTRIDPGEPPKIQGVYGRYYDAILTQYGMEWELHKALLKNGLDGTDSLRVPGTLPLRESVEACGNPLYSGAGRCAALATSTLLVFKTSRSDGFFSLIRRRSEHVGVSPGMLHVIPAGMFEARNYDIWSAENNVWRELLEEVYNDKEESGSAQPDNDDRIRQKVPVNLLIEMIGNRSAEFSVTGICCDLLSLRHEICTILLVDDASFYDARPMQLNWEYEALNWKTLNAGRLLVPLREIDDVLEIAFNTSGVTPTGAACIYLGLNWLQKHHGLNRRGRP